MGTFTPMMLYTTSEITGNPNSYSLAIGLMVLMQALGSFLVGKKSDKNRSLTVLVLTIMIAILTSFFVLAKSEIFLYSFLTIFGVVIGGRETVVTAYLGDLTKTKTRGAKIGRYDAVVGLSVGLTMMFSGIININVSHFSSILMAVSSLYLLFSIRKMKHLTAVK